MKDTLSLVARLAALVALGYLFTHVEGPWMGLPSASIPNHQEAAAP